MQNLYGMCKITYILHIQGVFVMRTNVVLNDDLIRTALKLSGFKTKKKAIEEGLKLLVQLNRQKNVRGFRGKLKWEGNLNKMRIDK